MTRRALIASLDAVVRGKHYGYPRSQRARSTDPYPGPKYHQWRPMQVILIYGARRAKMYHQCDRSWAEVIEG